jgi:NADH-quinone oxidoreductase subunit G
MPRISIDGIEYEVEAGRNLLESALGLGLDLPYFCWHPAMGSIGACRQCAVVQYQNAEDERGRIVMACMTPVTDGAIFSLAGDKAAGFRRAIVESLMLNHPHDCPVCAEGGECHLQDMTVMTGHRDRHYRGRKNSHRNQNLGPLINHEMNRCITCYRCTRYYRDYAGGTDLAALAGHDHVYFGRHTDGVLQSEFAGNLVEVCPTGVFTDKTLVNDYTRKWDLQSAPSVCTGCAAGCNTLPGERYGKLKRVHNRFNAQVNGYFLCDRGRFGAAYVNHEKRLRFAGLRDADGRYNAVDHPQALQHMAAMCHNKRVAGVGSPRASVEANYLLRQLVGPDNFCPGSATGQQALESQALALLQQYANAIPDLPAVESADAIVILGEDVTNTAPRLALALRQSVRNKAYEMAADLRLEHWQDAAIRNLAQDQRSPLLMATTGNTPLDDVAQARISLAPADIARLGEAIASEIGGSENNANTDFATHAKTTADILRSAKRPLIVSGTGAGNGAIMNAAAAICQALQQSGQPCMLSLVVPEANSMGQALLAGPEAPNLDLLIQRAQAGEIDTLLVLENDLYRRAPSAQIDTLLGSVDNVVVLDGMENATVSHSTLALPAASALESEGTLVSSEGRAQRHFQVFSPGDERHSAWHWLLSCMRELGRQEVENIQHFDDVTRACASDIETLAGMPAAAPDHHFRNVGVKIPRQPHRYSGRTAMRADISVHEPKQKVDEESPLAFTMEGLNSNQPGALLPFVWSPGWNSNQSLHKFQSEVGGPLKGGTAGVRLISQSPSTTPGSTATPGAGSGAWLLVPRQRIFGSDELSARSTGVEQLVEPGFVELRAADAAQLQVTEGDGVVIGDDLAKLAVKINDELAPGCIGFSEGLEGTFNLRANSRTDLCKATDWQRSPELIAREGGGHV